MFYDRFIELCNKKGIKPTPLVISMGLSSSNVSQWKKGSTPRPDVLQKLSEYFDVPVSYLMFGEDDEKNAAPETESGLTEKDIRVVKWFNSLPPKTRKALLTLGGGPEDLA